MTATTMSAPGVARAEFAQFGERERRASVVVPTSRIVYAPRTFLRNNNRRRRLHVDECRRRVDLQSFARKRRARDDLLRGDLFHGFA